MAYEPNRKFVQDYCLFPNAEVLKNAKLNDGRARKIDTGKYNIFERRRTNKRI